MTTEEAKNSLLTTIAEESSDVLAQFGPNIISQLGLTRTQVFGVLRKVVAPLENIFKFQLLKTPTNIFKELKQQKILLRDKAGLRWQLRFVGGKAFLCVWLELKVFFEFFLGFIDGAPIFRFGEATDSNGWFKFLLKY